MATTSIVGRLSGLLSYADGGVGSFWCCVDADGFHDFGWGSVGGDVGASDAEFAFNVDHRVKKILDSIPSVGDVVFTPVDFGGRVVTDLVLDLSVTVTDSDGFTFPLSASFDRGVQTIHFGGDQVIGSEYVDRLFGALSVLCASTPVLNVNKPLRVVDTCGDGRAKCVVMYIRDVAPGFDESGSRAWKRLILNGNSIEVNPLGGNSIRGSIGGVSVPLKAVTVGRAYQVTNGVFVDRGAASAGNKTEVFNVGSSDLTVEVVRDGSVIEVLTIGASANKAFIFQPKFYIWATYDLGFDGTFSEASALGLNTQISYLGVVTADVNVGLSGDVFQFTLANITF